MLPLYLALFPRFGNGSWVALHSFLKVLRRYLAMSPSVVLKNAVMHGLLYDLPRISDVKRHSREVYFTNLKCMLQSNLIRFLVIMTFKTHTSL